MVEQPSPAPEGVPAGGAPSPEGAIGPEMTPPEEAPPSIMNLLSSLSGEGEASASVRTINRR